MIVEFEDDTLTWHWKPARRLTKQELAAAKASMHRALELLTATIAANDDRVATLRGSSEPNHRGSSSPPAAPPRQKHK